MQQFFLRTTNYTEDTKNVAINLIWRLGGLQIDRDLFRQIGQRCAGYALCCQPAGCYPSADCALGGQPGLEGLLGFGHQVTRN